MVGEMIRKKGLFNVAKKLNISPQRLNNWIRRKSYPTLYIRALSEILEIDTNELLKLIEKELTCDQ
jgi:DNA-binding phage protein